MAAAKIVVITGANGGLGQALAKRFVADGDTVVLLGRSLANVQVLAEALGERAHALECVVSAAPSVKEAFARIAEKFGKIDALINNAGIFKPSRLEEASDELIFDTVASNLTGSILCARSAIPLLNSGGHIINISSESVTTELPHLVLYQATKAGLERFSTSLNLELADQGIRVTVVRAGQMFSPGKAVAIDPEAGARFFEAALQRGFNLMTRGTSRYEATTDVFRMIIDSPPDVHIDTVGYRGRPVQY